MPHTLIADQTDGLIRSLNSLGPDDAVTATRLLRPLPEWTVEKHTDYDGNLTLMLSSANAKSTDVYTIERDSAGVQLAVVGETRYRRLATSTSVEAALQHFAEHQATSSQPTPSPT